MKFTIEGFGQEALLSFNCDPTDAIILRFIVDFWLSGNITIIHVGREDFFWINHKYLLNEIPIVGIKTAIALKRRFSRFVKVGLMEYHLHNGNMTCYRFIPSSYQKLLKQEQLNNSESKEVGKPKSIPPEPKSIPPERESLGGVNPKVRGGLTQKYTNSSIKDQSIKDQEERERETHTRVESSQVKIFKEQFGNVPLNKMQIEDLTQLPNLGVLRKTCKWWDSQGYKWSSIARFVERYHEIDQEFQRSTEQTRQTARHGRNGNYERSLEILRRS